MKKELGTVAVRRPLDQGGSDQGGSDQDGFNVAIREV